MCKLNWWYWDIIREYFKNKNKIKYNKVKNISKNKSDKKQVYSALKNVFNIFKAGTKVTILFIYFILS